MSQHNHLQCLIYFAKAILPNETISDINDFKDLKFFFKILQNKEKITIDNLCKTLNEYFEIAIHTAISIREGFIEAKDLFKLLYLCIIRYILKNADDDSKGNLQNIVHKVPEKYHDDLVSMIEPAMEQFTSCDTPITIQDIEWYLNFENEENILNSSFLNKSNRSISENSRLNQSFYHIVCEKDKRDLTTFTQFVSSPEFRSKVILRNYPESIQKEMYQKVMTDKLTLQKENLELGCDIFDKEKNITQLSKKNNNYEKEITKLKTTINDLNSMLVERDEKLNKMVEKCKVEKLEAKLKHYKSLQNDNDFYLKTISELKSKNETLTRQSKDMAELRKLCFKYQEDLDSMNSKYILTNEENSRLQQTLLESQNREIDLNDMIKELQTIVKPVDTSFQDSFTLAQQTLDTSTEGEAMSLVVEKQKEELEEKFNELIISTIPLSDHDKQISELNTKIDSLTRDAQIAQDMQHKFQNLLLNDVQPNADDSYLPDVIFGIYSKLQYDITHQTQQLTQLKSDIHSLSYIFNLDYTDSTTNNELISNIKDEILNLQKEKTQLSCTLQSVQSEINAFKQDIASNKQHINQFIKSAKDEVFSFYTYNCKFIEELTNNRDMLEELSNYYKKRCKDLKKEFSETNTELQKVINETQQLNMNISGYIAELTEHMQTKEAVIVDMQNTMKQNFQHELRMLLKNKYLTFQNNENDLKITEYTSSLESTTHKVTDLTVELSSVYKQYDQLKEVLKEKEFHATTLIKQHKDLDIFIEELQKQKVNLTHENEHLKQDCTTFNQKLMESQTSLSDYKTKHELVSQDLADKEFELSKLKSQLTDDESVKKKMELEISYLKRQIEDIQNDKICKSQEDLECIEKFKLEIEDLNQKLIETQTDLSHHKEKCKVASEYSLVKEAEVSELKRQNEDDKLVKQRMECEILDYKTKYEIESQNLAIKEVELSALKTETKDNESTKKKMELEISYLKHRIEDIQNDKICKNLEDVEYIKEKFKLENEDLNQKLIEAQTDLFNHKEKCRFASEYSLVKEAEVSELKRQNEDNKLVKQRMEQLVFDLQHEIEDLKRDIVQNQQASMVSTEIQERTKCDNIELNQKLLQMQTNLSIYRKKYETSCEALSSTEAEIFDIKQQFNDEFQKLELDNSNLQKQIDNLTRESFQKQTSIDEKSAELQKTTEKLHSMSNKLFLLEKNVEKEIITFQQSTERQKEQRDETNTWREKFYSINQQYNSLHTNYRLETENYQETLSKVEDERDKFAIQLEQKEEEFKIHMDEKNQEVANIKSDLFETRRFTLIRRQELESNLERLDKSLKSKETQFEGMKKKLEENLQQERKEKLKYKELYEQELNEVNTKWKKELDKSKLDLDDKTQKIEHLETELRNIIGDMYKTEEVNSKLKSNEKKLEQQLHHVSEELKELQMTRVDSSVLEKEIRLLTMRLEGKDTELNSRLTEIRELDDRIELANKRVMRHIEKISELELKLNEAKEENDKSKKEKIHFKEEIDQYKEQIDLLNGKEKRQLLNKMKLETSYKERIASLEEDMRDIRSKYENRSHQVEQIRIESAAKDKVIMALQAKFSKVPDENWVRYNRGRYEDKRANTLRPQSRSSSDSTSTNKTKAQGNAYPCEDEPSCLIIDKTPFVSRDLNTKLPSSSSLHPRKTGEPDSDKFKKPLPKKGPTFSQSNLKRRDGFRKVLGQKLRSAFRNNEKSDTKDKKKKYVSNTNKEALLTKMCTSPTHAIKNYNINSTSRQRIDKILETLDVHPVNKSIVTDLDDTFVTSQISQVDNPNNFGYDENSSVDSLFLDNDNEMNTCDTKKIVMERFAKDLLPSEQSSQNCSPINVIPETPLPRKSLHRLVEHKPTDQNPSITSNSIKNPPVTSSNSTNSYSSMHNKRNHRLSTTNNTDELSTATNVTPMTFSRNDLSNSASSLEQPLPPKTPKTNNLILKLFQNSRKPKNKK